MTIRKWMNLFEGNNEKIKFSSISRLAKKYKYKIMDVEQSIWELDENLNPIIIITPKDINRIFDTKDESIKYFFDPFFGIFPHEYNEAIVAVQLLLGQYDLIINNYQIKKSYIKKDIILNKVPVFSSIEDLKKNINSDIVDRAGGVAHDIIIHKNRKEYYDYISQYFD